MATQIPTWTVQVNAFEAGVLMGMLEDAPERVKRVLFKLRQQLIAMKRDIEKADGVTKTILPNGMLELIDVDGTRIIRPPYSWEVEGN